MEREIRMADSKDGASKQRKANMGDREASNECMTTSSNIPPL